MDTRGVATIIDPIVSAADLRDAEQLLDLQRLCYQSEAALYHDRTIPPLAETLTELRASFATHRILTARSADGLVGSVRGHLIGDTCHIGRLVVHPTVQRRGYGARLMHEIEASFPDAARFALFTGHRSEGNLRLYHRLGYAEFRRDTRSPHLDLVYLEKPRPFPSNPAPK